MTKKDPISNGGISMARPLSHQGSDYESEDDAFHSVLDNYYSKESDYYMPISLLLLNFVGNPHFPTTTI